jgi:hypothetical protein
MKKLVLLIMVAAITTLSCQETPTEPSLRGDLPQVGDPIGFDVFGSQLGEISPTTVSIFVATTDEADVEGFISDRRACQSVESPMESVGHYTTRIECTDLEPEYTYDDVRLIATRRGGPEVAEANAPVFTTPSAAPETENIVGPIEGLTIDIQDFSLVVKISETDEYRRLSIFYIDAFGQGRSVFSGYRREHNRPVCVRIRPGTLVPMTIQLLKINGEVLSTDTTVTTIAEFPADIDTFSVERNNASLGFNWLANKPLIIVTEIGIIQGSFNRFGIEGWGSSCGVTEATEHFFGLTPGERFFYRVKGVNPDSRDTVFVSSGEDTVRTAGIPLPEPKFLEVAFSDITFKGSLTSAELNRLGIVRVRCSTEGPDGPFRFCASMFSFTPRTTHEFEIRRQPENTEVFVRFEFLTSLFFGLGSVVAADTVVSFATLLRPPLDFVSGPTIIDSLTSENTTTTKGEINSPVRAYFRARVKNGPYQALPASSSICQTSHQATLTRMARDTVYMGVVQIVDCDNWPSETRRVWSDSFEIRTLAGPDFIVQTTPDTIRSTSVRLHIETSPRESTVKASCSPRSTYNQRLDYNPRTVHLLEIPYLLPDTLTTCITEARETGVNRIRPIIADTVTFRTPPS